MEAEGEMAKFGKMSYILTPMHGTLYAYSHDQFFFIFKC